VFFENNQTEIKTERNDTTTHWCKPKNKIKLAFNIKRKKEKKERKLEIEKKKLFSILLLFDFFLLDFITIGSFGGLITGIVI